GIAVGRYDLRVSATGFTLLVRKVALTADKPVRIDVTLQVGAVGETMDVSRGPAQKGAAGGVPGGAMGGVLGGIIGGVPSVAPPSPPQAAGSGLPDPHRYRAAPVEARENYGHFVENRFQSPVTTPLSTFSIDVDTASYANMRRFLREGRRPPKD